MKLQLDEITEDHVKLRMPFNSNFCINKEQGLLHGGILTALMDSAFGLVIYVGCKNIAMMATIDLRVDYLRPAKSKSDLIVIAELYRETRHVAFVRGSVKFDGPNELEIAQASGSFVLDRGSPEDMLKALEAQA